MEIGKKRISKNNPPLLIAELGINHGGSFAVAKTMAKQAIKAGADIVKIQSHRAEEEMDEGLRQVYPLNSPGESIYDLIRRCSLTPEEEYDLKILIEDEGGVFMSTPFSFKAVDDLEAMGVVGFKIGSGELTNIPLLRHIAKVGKPVIMSTGMSTLGILERATDVFNDYQIPFALLHTTSAYPTPFVEARLKNIDYLNKQFRYVPVGYSDHTVGIEACIGAVARGATIIEKHFALKGMDGPDVICSATPWEFSDMAYKVRNVYLAVQGKEEKEVFPIETSTTAFARAHIILNRKVKAGDVLGHGDITTKRAFSEPWAVPALSYDAMIGSTVAVDLNEGAVLKWTDITCIDRSRCFGKEKGLFYNRNEG